MNTQASYNPFIVNNLKANKDSDYINIPESSFLDPIQLSDEIVKSAPWYESNTYTAMSPDDPFAWARSVYTPMSEREEYVTLPNDDRATLDSPVDWTTLKHNQMLAESSGNPNAISRAGAKGLYQITDVAHSDYLRSGGEDGDLFDPEYNTKVRDWYMDWLSKSSIINTPGVSEYMKAVRQLVAYNWGIGKLKNLLTKWRSNGKDVDNSLAWLAETPEETQNYVKKIMS